MYKVGDKVLFLPTNEVVEVVEDQGEGTIWVKQTLGPDFFAHWDEVRILTPLELVLL